MRFCYLGSGSRGNAALVEYADTLLMIDCGFSLAETRRRLQRVGRTPEDLTAILVTHEHGDHAAGVATLARATGVPVHLTPGTAGALGALATPTAINAHAPFDIGAIRITPMPVPHDAREPCQFRFDAGGRRLGILTDVGHITPFLRESLADCDALVIECNYEPELLASGPYPAALKRRVGGRLGHLGNEQAADLVAGVDRDRLQWLVGVHLSEQNNTPEHAGTRLTAALADGADRIRLADQSNGLDWHELV